MTRAALLCLALLVLAGCGGGATGVAAPARAVPRQAQADPVAALLARRAAALAARDPRAYAATASGAQRRRDRRAATRARRLPLGGVALQASSVAVEGGVARARVVLAYRFRGVPGTFSATRTLVLRQGSAGWRVTADRGSRERAPWEVADYRMRARGAVRALAPARLATPGLLRAVARARVRLRRTFPVPARLLVVVARDPRAAHRLTARIRGLDRLAAIADLDVRQEGPQGRVQAVLARRLVLVWSRFGRLDARARARVLAHELTHLALAGQTSGRTPAWLLEGIALWSSGDDRRAQAARVLRDPGAVPGLGAAARRDALSLEALDRPDAIARLSGLAQGVAYAYASAAAYRVVQRHGPRRLLALYRAFNEREEGADAILREVLGTSLDGLERDLRASLRSL